ncbi:hypothetical protein FRC0129_02036 [Corynebacterium diphtheriae]|nr:hypothetical protein CDIPH_09785 [Corynebacterium diphtheriae]CAB0616177.1 hypothetical protein CIP107549_02022 [Corynebacterium diphtheriae]CAB0618068.1 hypothetical protein CIP107542_02028 [Corynebacterium diphtheriae]CAB0760564.1 hypothetical protein FRC0129_02036 [Corynebacterium diphtheriae]CAB0828111.1 hypothetical protein FRC0293_01866 [Corynebacterium diphtheriae]
MSSLSGLGLDLLSLVGDLFDSLFMFFEKLLGGNTIPY